MNKKNYMFGFSIFTLLLLSSITLGVMTVTAEDGVGEEEEEFEDEIDDAHEDETERSIQIEVENDQVEIESQLKNGDTKDSLTIHLKQESEGIKFIVEYESEIASEGSSEENEMEVEYEVEFRELIEFVDEDADGVLSSGDTEISSYQISSFVPIQHSVEALSADTNLYYFLASTADEVFKIHAFIAEEYATINDTALITPTELKIDIEITDYNFLQSDTKLALYARLSAEQEYEHDDETEDEKNGYSESESEVQIQSADTTAFFSWSEKALVDGVETNVQSTQLTTDDEMEDEQMIYFIYEQGASIYHDPKIGIEGLLTPPSSLQLVLTIGAIVGIVAVAGILIKKRK